jgi:hypothetical protein
MGKPKKLSENQQQQFIRYFSFFFCGMFSVVWGWGNINCKLLW